MKKIEQPALTTKYEELLEREAPHGYYPRPQMKRDSFINLNGEWDFAAAKSGEEISYTRRILVPFPPESKLSGISETPEPDELLYYRRSFTLPDGFMKDRLLLHFGAVDQIATVYINGREVGRHEGGYIPFSFDITDFATEDENLIEVAVKDSLDVIYPYGKQTIKRGGMWYTPVSGIWQTVWLESVPENYIKGIKLTPDLNGVTVEVDCASNAKRIKICGVGEYEFSADSLRIDIDRGHLWSPEDPYLYSFTLECAEDKIESYFALREVAVKEINGRQTLTLNGKPYLFSGLLDQGYYPDGIFLPATVGGYEDDILLAKSMGFNMLRKHIKIEPMIFYYLCDKLGIAVFQDMVNNGKYSFMGDTVLPTVGFQRLADKKRHPNVESRRIFVEAMMDTAELLYNTPSVVYYTIFNEGWGQFDADGAYRLLKNMDPSRIIDSTSGWFRRYESDVDSRHIYFKKLKITAPSGKPVSLSEFGGYSHRVDGHVFGDSEYGYRSFSDMDKYRDEVSRLYLDQVAPIVRDGACALVYTQLSDVEDETNGLITYDRRVVKVDAEKIRSINRKLYEEFNS